MRPKFIADADLNPRIIAGLRRREPAIDFLTAADAGIVGVSDPEVLSAAARLDRILISCDRNTMVRHFRDFIKRQFSPGLIIIPQELPIGDVLEDLLLVWVASEAEEWQNVWFFLPL